MQKSINIKYTVLKLYLEHFLDSDSVLEILEEIKETYKEVYQTSISINVLKNMTYSRVMHHFIQEKRQLLSPKSLWLVKLESGRWATYLGTEENIAGSQFFRSSEEPPQWLFPMWLLKGQDKQMYEYYLDRMFVQSSTAKVTSYHVLNTDLVYHFFKYLENSLQRSESISDSDTIKSFYRDEQLGVLETTQFKGNSYSVVSETLCRNKVLRYSRTNQTGVTTSTPDSNPRHREPNPSDRSSFRPYRPISSPAYQMEWEITNPTVDLPIKRVASDDENYYQPSRAVRQRKTINPQELKDATELFGSVLTNRGVI
jgi:hypothetical protein